MMDPNNEGRPQTAARRPAATAVLPDLTRVTDHQLVAYMAQKMQNRELAEVACGELYRRHQPFLLRFSMRRRWETDLCPSEDLVDLAFIKAWDRAHRFETTPVSDASVSERRVRNWLLQILNRVFLTAYRKQGDTKIVALDELSTAGENDVDWVNEGLVFVVATDTKEIPSIRKDLVREFLEATDARTRLLLTEIGQHWNVATKQTEFPPEVRESLCVQLGWKPVSLRVNCGRALAALKEFILQNETKKQKTP